MDVYQGLAVAAFVVGVVAVILAIVFYGRSRRTKEPSWAIRSSNLVTGATRKLPRLDMSYAGERVDTLTVSRIVVWNRGAETIDSRDIDTADPLRVQVVGDDVRLLDVDVLDANNEASRFSRELAPDRCAARLRFDYLDRGQGAVLQVVHSGRSSKDVEVVGAIKGAGSPVKRVVKVVQYLPLPTSGEFDRSLRPQTRRRVAGIVPVVPAFTTVLVVVPALLVRYVRDGAFEWSFVGLGGMMLALVVAWAAIYFATGVAPRGLETFEEEIV